MFIVIEGTDASGKTTLIAAIEQEMRERYPGGNIMMFHKGKPGELTRRWVLNDYVLSIEKYDWSRQAALSDRWHWGEVTYAPKYRPDTNKDGFGLLGEAGWRWTELFLKSRGVAQFWLYQPLEVIEKRLSSRGDEFVQVEDLQTILWQYEIANKHSMIQERLRPSSDSLESLSILAAHIVDVAEHIEETVSELRGFPEYIGGPKPDVLLVGDRHNATKRYGHETDLAFMPVDGNSGEFLLSALPEDFWKNVGIINVNDHRDTFTELWRTIGSPPIIALGRQAEKGLMGLGMTESHYTVLPHPQFVRRFANNKKTEYGEAIARLSKTNDKEDKWVLR